MRRLVLLMVALLVGATALAGCGLQAYDLPLPGKVVSGSAGYQLSAVFANVDNVVPRTVVMVHDVPIGQVDSVTRDGWDAKVVMTIKKDIVLPADTTASVQQDSLLGSNYIALRAPSGSTVAKQGRLGDGSVIPLAHTGDNPQVEDVLGALSMLLSGGGVDQLKTISTEMNKMMDGRQGQIRDLLTQVDRLVGSLNDQRDTIIDAMKQVDTLTSTLNREQSVIVDALNTFGPALKALHQQRQALMTMLTSLDKLGTVATRVIHESGASITQSLESLEPVLAKLGAANNSLPRGLVMAASFPFPKQASTLAKGDYSNALFHMDFDLNKIVKGITGGTNMGLPEVLQLCYTYAKQCSAIQPVVDALCQLTHLEFACSMVGKSGGSSGSTTSGKKSKQSDSSSAIGSLAQQLLGNQTPSGSPSSSSSSSASSGTGLGGLLGSLLGGGQ